MTAAALALVAACADDDGADIAVGMDLDLPGHFPAPLVPADNPLTTASVELGRHLFYDDRLSVNRAISCSSCHRQELAFADDQPVSAGATGELGVLNAPSLGNVIYAHPLTWAHGEMARIEDQLIGPMFGEAPLEMGITGAEDLIVQRLRDEPAYADLIRDAFGDPAIDLDRARYALASFVRSLVTHRSPFDAFLAGDRSAISDSARCGSELFYTARLGCGGCHVGFAFTSAARSSTTRAPQLTPFHNIGLYNLDGDGSYPATARGLIDETGVARDMGRFRVPSLRNVELTAPYMHDGSVATLDEVLDIYEAGGRVIADGPNAGDGRANPHRSADLPSFELSDTEREDLLAFLRSLTDVAFASDPRHASPW